MSVTEITGQPMLHNNMAAIYDTIKIVSSLYYLEVLYFSEFHFQDIE